MHTRNILMRHLDHLLESIRGLCEFRRLTRGEQDLDLANSELRAVRALADKIQRFVNKWKRDGVYNADKAWEFIKTLISFAGGDEDYHSSGIRSAISYLGRGSLDLASLEASVRSPENAEVVMIDVLDELVALHVWGRYQELNAFLHPGDADQERPPREVIQMRSLKMMWRDGRGGRWTRRIRWLDDARAGTLGSENIRLELMDKERETRVYPKDREEADAIWEAFKNLKAPEGENRLPKIVPDLSSQFPHLFEKKESSEMESALPPIGDLLESLRNICEADFYRDFPNSMPPGGRDVTKEFETTSSLLKSAVSHGHTLPERFSALERDLKSRG